MVSSQLSVMKAAVDANVFIHGRGNFDFKVFTVPDVIEELRSENSRNVLESTGYRIEEPGQESIERVEDMAKEINSPTSPEDENLVALALEKDYTLVSDDKAVQNLGLHLGVDVRGFLENSVREKIEWKPECKNCGKKFSKSSCSGCGSSSRVLKQVRCS
ncbi:MAG: NOB1 family endonuclease [Candidatus Nanohaloarchaea archaeon]